MLFVFVQLAHELSLITKFQRTNTSIISLALQNSWEKMAIYKLSPEEKAKFLGRKLKSLQDSKEITQAYILGKNNRIIFSTEKSLEGKNGDFDDTQTINAINEGKYKESGPLLDKERKIFALYLPLKEQGNIQFLLRLFFPLADIWQAYRQVYQPAFTIGVLLIFLNILLGAFLAHLIIAPIKVFNEIAKSIASGRLDLRIKVATGDELEQLGRTFNFMTEELIKMKEKAENANPLTKLPGNIVIREEIEKRINENKKFTVIYCDLDNFKAFNDEYGIAQGDEAIKLTGDIFKDAVKKAGNSEDFIGHEGGDDFLLLTTPEKTQAVTDCIISEFDKRIRSLYSLEDLNKGFIVAHARDGSVQNFPIMTISLAGITNEHRSIQSYAEVTNIAAELKKKAKKIQKSCFVLDQRKNT
jgi:diguanylate cyclase (GGDEF)-like protein